MLRERDRERGHRREERAERPHVDVVASGLPRDLADREEQEPEERPPAGVQRLAGAVERAVAESVAPHGPGG